MSASDKSQDGKDTPMTPAPARVGRGRGSTSDRAFDIWLDRSLHAMFDEVAKEPIPPELLRLIEQDRKR